MDVGKLDVGTTFDNEDLGLPKTLPQLCGGWNVLVYPIALKTQLKSGLFISESTADTHSQLLTVGIVVKMGPLAYKHGKFKDPTDGEYKALCKEGDFVVFSRAAWSATRSHEGKKFYLIPDENIDYRIGHPAEANSMYSYDDNEINFIKQQIAALPKDVL